MLVAQSTLSHVGQFDGAFRTCVHEPVATFWVEFGGSDHLGQLLHVRGFDVDNVEALILNVQVPQVYSQVIAAEECLSVAVDGYAIDVISMSVGVGATRDCGNDSVMMSKAWKPQGRSIAERRGGIRPWSAATTANGATRC